MSTLTIRTILAAALLIASTATAALAQSPPPGPGGPLGGMRGPMGQTDGELWLMIRAAALTPDQQAKVRGILSTHRATTRPLIEQLRQAQQELGAKLLAPGPLQSADLQPQLGRIGQLRDQLA
ncbi:MAG TPA: periplasmic heavy metal sensor, partial [Methylomirabilota bacterium]|nr:periplasmic heavy metal sensor [Methylomirabilota bacterium]